MNYLLLLCLVNYRNFKRFHRVVFLEEGAIYHFWHIFYRFLSPILRPSLCKNKFDNIFFFHHELSSSAMLSLLSKFKRFHRVVFLEEGAIYHFGIYFFYRFLSQILRSSLCKDEFDDIFFFHHELSSSAILSLLSKFQNISLCSFLRRGRYIPLMA